MTSTLLQQRTIFEDPSQVALFLPLGEGHAALHPGGRFALAVDPRTTADAAIIGMMVLRPAVRSWLPRFDADGSARDVRDTRDAQHVHDLRDMQQIDDWCFDVAGIGGSWPISAGNAFDAYRLALQYGTVDAVMDGSSTIVREGVESRGRRAHLWQPYTPLSWPSLRALRTTLEPQIARIRSRWQELGVLSSRRYPAQIAVTQSGAPAGLSAALLEGSTADLLDARIFDARHPDGSPVEAYVLTSSAGAEKLSRRAKARGQNIDSKIIEASAAGDPETIDLARVPELLRTRLDLRMVQHDGGATSLAAFAAAGAISQLNFTLMRNRSVRDVLAATDRIDDAARKRALEEWPAHARLFPPGGGPLPGKLAQAVAEQGDGAEGVAVVLNMRSASVATGAQ